MATPAITCPAYRVGVATAAKWIAAVRGSPSLVDNAGTPCAARAMRAAGEPGQRGAHRESPTGSRRAAGPDPGHCCGCSSGIATAIHRLFRRPELTGYGHALAAPGTRGGRRGFDVRGGALAPGTVSNGCRKHAVATAPSGPRRWGTHLPHGGDAVAVAVPPTAPIPRR